MRDAYRAQVPMTSLMLAQSTLDAVFAHAREDDPDEVCGAIVRRGGTTQIRRIPNVQNELHAADPALHTRTAETAYAMGRDDLDWVYAQAEDAGADLVIYHSHSRNGSYFSDEDKRAACWDDDPLMPRATYLVVSDARVRDEARAFRWDETARDFVEVPIEVTT